MEDTVKIAEEIAREAHEGQKRKFSADPYITHPERMAEKAPTTVLKAASWLHDVIEDTEFTASDLLQRGITKSVVELVLAVTRRDNETYKEFIERVYNHSQEARDLKIIDISDNMSDLSTTEPLYKRYSNALARLRS